MEYRNLITKMFVVFSLYLFIMYQCRSVQGAHGNGNNPESHRPRLRSNSRFRQASQYSRLKPDNVVDFLADDDDLFELSKRQSSDDYGHLRFGKRGEEQFDDYGHMRFGRAGGNEK